MKSIFISAGDPSADLYGAHLIKYLKSVSDIKTYALGGDNIKSQTDYFIYDLVGLNVHGFWEPVKRYFKLREIFENVKKMIIRDKVDAILLIDFYGFNIKIAEFAHNFNIPAYYYICPQIWADRFWRIKKIKKYIKKAFLIYPFEEKIYKEYNVDALYVGHPLIHIIPKVNEEEKDNIVGLFPGSRENVIHWHLGLFEKLSKINKEFQFVIFGLKHLSYCYNTKLKVIFDENYEFRKRIKFAVSTSGTVVLENSLLGIPSIVVYKLPLLWYGIARMLIRVPYISIVNILYNQEVLPELIQFDANAEDISKLLNKWISDQFELKMIYEKISKLREILGDKNPAEIITNEILRNL